MKLVTLCVHMLQCHYSLSFDAKTTNRNQSHQPLLHPLLNHHIHILWFPIKMSLRVCNRDRTVSEKCITCKQMTSASNSLNKAASPLFCFFCHARNPLTFHDTITIRSRVAMPFLVVDVERAIGIAAIQLV
jgi:hypothetical protein